MNRYEGNFVFIRKLLRELVGIILVLLTGIALLSCTALEKTSQQTSDQTKKSPVGQKSEAGISIDISSVPQRTNTKVRYGRSLEDFVTANFVGSSLCAACHEMLVDKDGNDVSISNHWRSTMMANAARDPFWQAKVSSEVDRNPALKKIIEKKCISCHMPMAWIQASSQNVEGYMLGNGFLSSDSKFHKAAMDGVSCTLCHQIQDNNLGTPESFSGKYTIDTSKTDIDRKIFGPYQDIEEGIMQTSVKYTPVYGQHTNDSALCATCHTLFTPFVNKEGNVAGTFPEQTAFLEWLHSDYGVAPGTRFDMGENKGKEKLCQECHMPHSDAGVEKIAKYAPPESKEKDHFSQHHFVGGNVFMLNILQDNLVNLDLTASTIKLEDTKNRTINQLRNNSAKLSIIQTSVSSNEITAVVRVDNLAGHKFPTGFPSRNTWIYLVVSDKKGNKVFESGLPMANGKIAGNDADENLSSYEPHYEVITSQDQVQIYEAVMANTEGEVTRTLLRAAAYLKDNRLLPGGFDKTTAGSDIAVYGNAANDENFVGGSDEVTYRIPLNGHKGPFTIQATLLYNSVSQSFMADLEKDSHLDLVKRFKFYYDRADKMPVAVASVEAKIR